ncbi:MAG: hypothetical protein IKX85_04935 [Clostridia bacterium]|nr:hypothetical protein [Clostridia bacterium]
MKLLKLVCLWAALLALLAGCALEPYGIETGTDGEEAETPASESETAPESEPGETGTKEGQDVSGGEVLSYYEDLGIKVREIRRIGTRFLVWSDSLSVEEGYEPNSVFEIYDPAKGERTYLLETDGPAVSYDVRTHEDGTITLMALQQDFYGDRARGRNGEVVSAAERVTANGLRTVERYTEPFLYPLGCPFTVGTVLEEKYLKEVELKNVRLSADESPYLYLAFGWKGKDGEAGPVPAAEITGGAGEIRVLLPGIGLNSAVAGEHKVEAKSEDDPGYLFSWKAEKTGEGVLLTVRTGEAVTRAACYSVGVRGGSELLLRPEALGYTYPDLSYQDR